MLDHIKDNNNRWTVIVESKPYQFDSSHKHYDTLVELVMSGDAETFAETIQTGLKIRDWSKDGLEYKAGNLYFNGEKLSDSIVDRILSLISCNHDFTPMSKFLQNLYANVSNRAVKESYNWCSHKGLPIDKSGFLIGYKGLAVYSGEDRMDAMNRPLKSGDYVDKYTQTIRNNVGDVNEMLRRRVCDDHNIGCSEGLHVGTYEYASDWAGSGGVVVLVKFNPADIVSVPSDCSFQKIRVCKYTVIDVARGVIEEPVFDDEELDDLDDLDDIDDDYYHDCDDSDCDDDQLDMPF